VFSHKELVHGGSQQHLYINGGSEVESIDHDVVSSDHDVASADHDIESTDHNVASTSSDSSQEVRNIFIQPFVCMIFISLVGLNTFLASIAHCLLRGMAAIMLVTLHLGRFFK